jgi:1-deoxy-D-xylulose-5-phosphate reductoisomerase
MGESMPAVMNGANEVAVEAFLRGKIGFLDIPALIEKTMEAHYTLPVESIEQVMETDKWARQKANELLMRP